MSSDPAASGWSTHSLASRFEESLPGVVALMRAYETAALGRTDTTAAEAEAELRAPEVDRNHSAVVLRGDEVIGLRLVFVDPAEREVTLDCWIHPQLPDADQRSLLGELAQGAHEVAARLATAAEPVPPAEAADPWQASPRVWQLVAGAYRQDRVWSEQLQSLGLRQVRTFQRMRLEHGLAVPEPTPPAGVAVHDAVDVSDLRDAWSVHQRAFADHWGGEAQRDFDAWVEYQKAFAGFDPTLWSVAVLDDEPVGLCAASDSRVEDGISYVPLLGIVREARGRGIARFLLRREFARSARRGLPITELTVDSESLTGADRLYRSVGMAPTVIIDSWLRPIRTAAPPESA